LPALRLAGRRERPVVLPLFARLRPAAADPVPRGEMTKEQVRKIASSGPAVYEKRESQDICFVTDDSYTRFSRAGGSAKTAALRGPGGTSWATTRGSCATRSASARGSGSHRRSPSTSWRSTRRGTRSSSQRRETFSGAATVIAPSFVSGSPPGGRFRATARVRYRPPGRHAREGVKDRLEVTFDTPQRSVTQAGPRPVRRDEVLAGAGSNARRLSS